MALTQPPVLFKDPFGFGPTWLANDGYHTAGTANDIQIGVESDLTADQKPDSTTILDNSVSRSATFACRNENTGKGAVALMAESDGAEGSVGVIGASNFWGVAGVATSTNIGVLSTPDLFTDHVGVFGAGDNIGVRGHGGPIGDNLPSPDARGGIFSSGFLQVIPVNPQVKPIQSNNAIPQVQLVPSNIEQLPVSGNIGDLFMVILASNTETAPRMSQGQLWVCTQVTPANQPLWQLVQMGQKLVPGGTPL